MNGNLKKLLNHTDEVGTFGLSAAVKKAGATVLLKVKAADALRLEGAGLAADIMQFGSRAVFEFVAVDNERTPLFVMQLDSTAHLTDLPPAKEQHENELCRKLSLPLVRLHAQQLSKKHLSSDVVAMLLEMYLIAKGIIQAAPAPDKPRATRAIDPEATGPLSLGPLSVMPSSVVHSDRAPMSGMSGGLTDARKNIRRVYESGKCRSPIPSSLMGVDLIGTHHAVGFLRVTDENVACSRIALRVQGFPTTAKELVEEILLHELYHELMDVIRGRSRSVTRAELGAMIATFRMRYKIKANPASVPPTG